MKGSRLLFNDLLINGRREEINGYERLNHYEIRLSSLDLIQGEISLFRLFHLCKTGIQYQSATAHHFFLPVAIKKVSVRRIIYNLIYNSIYIACSV